MQRSVWLLTSFSLLWLMVPLGPVIILLTVHGNCAWRLLRGVHEGLGER